MLVRRDPQEGSVENVRQDMNPTLASVTSADLLELPVTRMAALVIEIHQDSVAASK